MKDMGRVADSHDVIRVHGARENNLEEVDIDLPKRRLTVRPNLQRLRVLRCGQADTRLRHLGSPLTGVTYVFDEPTTGLHPHDIQRMNDLLVRLRDKGNTVLVVVGV